MIATSLAQDEQSVRADAARRMEGMTRSERLRFLESTARAARMYEPQGVMGVLHKATVVRVIESLLLAEAEASDG